MLGAGSVGDKPSFTLLGSAPSNRCVETTSDSTRQGKRRCKSIFCLREVKGRKEGQKKRTGVPDSQGRKRNPRRGEEQEDGGIVGLVCDGSRVGVPRVRDLMVEEGT